MVTKLKILNRVFFQFILIFLIANFLLINYSYSEPIKLGEDYELLDNPLPPHSNGDPTKIDVHEFFSVVCIHCYRFEGVLQDWVLQNKNRINFDRTQYIYEGSGLGAPILGEIYYSFKAMGIEDKMLLPFYKAVFEERLDFTNQEKLNNWLQKNSVDLSKFLDIRKSFGVNTAVSAANRRIIYAKVTSTPQLIIDGRYRITNTQSYSRVLEVADALISLVQFERKKNK